jgi:hypothetical protein
MPDSMGFCGEVHVSGMTHNEALMVCEHMEC